MFENVLRQAAVVERLRMETESDTLPNSLLFHGPEYAGKLTTALELARALTCEQPGAPWNCRCRSCTQQRLLMQPNTLMLGSRYFLKEMAVCGKAVCRQPMDATAYLFIRAVRKLLRRFDPVLWEDMEGRTQKIDTQLGSIAEALADFRPGTAQPVPAQPERTVRSIMDDASKIVSSIASENIPVQVVRAMTSWARISTRGGRKVAIMENADQMQEASRNALLKLLEEPPNDVYLVLLTTRRSAVIPTIASRLRPYAFTGRSGEDTREVLRRIFREPDLEYSSMREYFVKTSLEQAETIEELSRRFVAAAAADEAGSNLVSEVEGLIRGADRRDAFRYFGECLLGQLEQKLHGGMTLGTVERWSALVHQARHRVENLNIGVASALESLFYRMREANCESSSNVH